MNLFILGLTLLSICIATVNVSEIPDYEVFLQDPEVPVLVSDWDVVPDDSTDLFAEDFTANAGNKCLSNNDIDDINLFSDIARVRPRNGGECVEDIPLPPYTDIYDSKGILNQLSPNPVIPGTQQDQDKKNILEELWTLPSFDPSANTNADDDDDDICPKEIYGDSRIPLCDTGSFRRNVLRPPGGRYYTVYGVRPYSKSDPCVMPQQQWCCFEVGDAHHPLDPPEAPPVPTGFLCMDPNVVSAMQAMNGLLPGFSEDLHPAIPDGKALGEE